MAVVHEGWVPRHGGRTTDYKLVDPTYVVNLMPAEDFWEKVRGIICAKYCSIDSIRIIVNGDGADWIRQGVTCFGNGMYQYDRFHIARELHRALRHDEKALGKAKKALKKDDIGSLSIIVTEAMLACGDVEPKEKLKESSSSY